MGPVSLSRGHFKQGRTNVARLVKYDEALRFAPDWQPLREAQHRVRQPAPDTIQRASS